MTPRPDFSRFNTATKCNQPLAPPPAPPGQWAVKRRKRIPASVKEVALWAVLLLVVVYLGWQSYRTGANEHRIAELEQIEAKVAELLTAHARQAELDRILGSEEATLLMDEDRTDGAVVRAIERAP